MHNPFSWGNSEAQFAHQLSKAKTFCPKVKMYIVLAIETIALNGRALQHIRQQAEDQDQGV